MKINLREVYETYQKDPKDVLDSMYHVAYKFLTEYCKDHGTIEINITTEFFEE